MRAATVLGIEPNKLWLQILPMQIVGIVIALATAFIWGNIEKRRGAGTEEVMEKVALEMQEEEEEATHIAIVMVVCRNCATFISPVVPATFLGVGLAGVEIKDHIKKCFFWIWGVSIICLISGLILGVIKL